MDDGRIFGKRGDADDVRRVAAARAFGVIGVDGAAGDGGDGVVDEARFVDGVGMDGDLNVEFVGHAQAGVDGRRRGAPILMQFQAAGAGAHLLASGSRGAGVAFSEKAEVHRPRFGGFEHARQIPAPGVQVVAFVPVAGPVPPPIMVVMPFDSAS